MSDDHERMSELVSRGFDAGNFASVYETDHYTQALERLKLPRVLRVLQKAYQAAFTLGFFSTYELDEMGKHREAYVEAYRSPGGQACVAAGYVEAREDIEE